MKSIRSHLLVYIFVVLSIVMAGADSPTQPNTGGLKGVVKDPTGAVVKGAVVTVARAGATQAATSDGQGRYRIGTLVPGEYNVRVTADGFADYEVSDVQIAAGTDFTFDATLSVAAVRQKVTVGDDQQPTVDPSSNAGAIVLKGSDLNALSDNPEELEADLLALAGPAAGPNGGEIFVDGFSNAKLPPKASIREIRVNQNPFAAEFDFLGYGRVEVFTKPGSDKFRTEMTFGINDYRFNSRNPFADSKPPYQRRNYGGTFEGPLGKRASFFFELSRADTEEVSIINATVLDHNFNSAPYRQSILSPNAMTQIAGRLDYQLSKNNTLVARYDWSTRAFKNSALDTFTLPSRAYDSESSSNLLQLTETAVLSPRSVNELRFQYWRSNYENRFASSDPSVEVPGAFTAGSSGLGIPKSRSVIGHLSDVLSLSRGSHMIKFGGRFRALSVHPQSGQNYNGTFLFTSLDAYRTTLLGLRDGLTPQQIRSLGGGASQFSIVTGDSSVDVQQADAGVFLQDDWRVRPTFTLSGGLRYELQTNISDRLSAAPRIGFAWAPGAQGRQRAPLVIRGGFGLFYYRVRETVTVESRRLDGRHQQQYLVPDPDFYPAIPATAALSGYKSDQVIRKIDPGIRASYMAQTAFSLERQFPKNVTLSLTFANTRGFRGLRSRNINAPLPDGSRPFEGGNIYQYESAGVFRQNQVMLNGNARVNRRFSLSGYYVWSKAESNYDSQASFPVNQYDFSGEYGRAGFDVRHRMLVSGTLTGPYGISLNPFVTASSGMPFNVTVGRDLNSDSIFNDRPVWATDLGRASVVRTAYGTFDLNPMPGQQIIPRNLGDGPGAVAVNMRLSKTFGFGERRGRAVGAEAEQVQAPLPRSDERAQSRVRARGASSGQRYSVTLSASARNLLNNVNLARPVGNLSSPRFGESVALSGGAAANRTIDFQVRLAF